MSEEDAETAAERRAEEARNNLFFAIRNWHKTEKTDGK